MLDRLTSMQVFVKAADAGSFTAAGVLLGLYSQMVGKHVRALEDRLGAPLLRRSTRRESLTDIGQLFLERCRTIIAEADAADAVIEAVAALPRGRLRISARVGFGAGMLAFLLTSFIDEHRGIEIELVLTDRYVDLIDEGYDAVLCLGPIGDTSLIALSLMRHEQIACASLACIASRGESNTPDELVGHDCLGFINASGLPYVEWRFGRDGIIYPVRIHPRFRVNDGRVLVAAAIAGHGIILQPEVVVRESLQMGTLVPILANYTPPGRPLYLMFLDRIPQPRKLRALVNYLGARIGD